MVVICDTDIIVDLVSFSPSYFITDKLYHINLYLVYLRHERNSNFSDGRDYTDMP
jgi:hypothetical protein